MKEKHTIRKTKHGTKKWMFPEQAKVTSQQDGMRVVGRLIDILEKGKKDDLDN